MSSFCGQLLDHSGLVMATPGDGSVQPTVEDSSKETPKPSAEERDAGEKEVTPKAKSDAAAGDAKAKEEAIAHSKSRSLSPEPELGNRSQSLLNSPVCILPSSRTQKTFT